MILHGVEVVNGVCIGDGKPCKRTPLDDAFDIVSDASLAPGISEDGFLLLMRVYSRMLDWLHTDGHPLADQRLVSMHRESQQRSN